MITDKYNTIFGLFVYVCTIYPESSSQNVQPPPLPCPVAAVLHTRYPPCLTSATSIPGTRDLHARYPRPSMPSIPLTITKLHTLGCSPGCTLTSATR